MGSFIDLSGNRFGRLTVIERDHSKNGKVVFWLCKCDCGKTKSVSGGNLRSGHTKSCGCLKLESEASHFLSNDSIRKKNIRLYSIWKSMKRRCYSKKHKAYHNYGGRGIFVCDEWIGNSGFHNFVEWAIKNGYCDNLTIDRIDVNKEYSPDNCRWITYKEQQNNRRNNRYITYKGETKTLAEWCEKYGIRFCTLERRLDELELPFEVAVNMDGLPKVLYGNKKISIRRLAQIKHVNYKSLLHEILVDGEEIEKALARLETSGISKIPR